MASGERCWGARAPWNQQVLIWIQGVGTGPPNKPQRTSQPVFHLQITLRSGLGGWGLEGADTRKLLAAVTSLVWSWSWANGTARKGIRHQGLIRGLAVGLWNKIFAGVLGGRSGCTGSQGGPQVCACRNLPRSSRWLQFPEASVDDRNWPLLWDIRAQRTVSQKKLLRSLHLWLINGLPIGHIWLPNMFCLYLHVLGFRKFLINLDLWLSLDFWMVWQHKTRSPVGWPGTGGTERLPAFQGPTPLFFHISTTAYYLTRHSKLWPLLGERVPKLFVIPGEAFSGWTVVRSFSSKTNKSTAAWGRSKVGDLLILSSVSLFWDTGKKPQDSMRHSVKTTEIARSIPAQARRLKPRERKRLI